MSELAQVVARGVDWVTATATTNDKMRSLWELGEQALSDVRQPLGVNLERTELRGYRGWIGEGIFLGQRPDSVMLRGSSTAAHDVFTRLYGTNERYNITRLDLQVTGKFDHDREHTAREAEAQAIAAMEKKTQVGRRKVESHRGNGRGDTCTIGSRSSQRYLRCYDKTREQRGQVDENLWRWEIEYKKPLSGLIALQVAAMEDPRRAIMRIVGHEFERKGVEVPWGDGQPIEIPTVGASGTSDETRLLWLNVQVKPVVTKLLQSVGLQAVLIALGLERLYCEEV